MIDLNHLFRQQGYRKDMGVKGAVARKLPTAVALGLMPLTCKKILTSAVVPGQPATVPANPTEGVEVLIAVWEPGGGHRQR